MHIAWQIAIIVLGVIVALPILYIILFFTSCLVINGKKTYEKPNKYYSWLMRSGHRFLFFFANIGVDITGIEKIPQGRCLLVSNHRSAYDPFCTWVVLHKKEITFISKEENMRIPLIGKLAKRIGCLPIDREDPRKAVKTISVASKLIAEDKLSVAVYPEGTRSIGADLLEFHNAVFKIAQKAQVPIVVLTVDGSEKIKKNFLFKRTHVKINVAEVIDKEFVVNSTTKDIGDRVKESMIRSLTAENK